MQESKQAQEITNRVYLGPFDVADSRKWLTDNKISHVIGVMNSKLAPYDSLVPGIEYTYMQLDDKDDADIGRVLDITDLMIAKILELPGARILVHCHYGISRSAYIIISHLMHSQAWSFDAAHSLVLQKRSCIDPNRGFVQHLKERFIL